MKLIDLLDGDEKDVNRGADYGTTEIAGLTCDSRRVEPGFLFAAIPGTSTDGRRFIAEAVARGAVAVLAPPGVQAAIPVLHDANPRRRYARMAARFQGRQPALVAAVTGTNGKTSVVSFTRQIWAALGRRAASLGTLGLQTSKSAREVQSAPGLTTADPADLHRSLAELADQGVENLAIEASSHGLDQYRLDGVNVTLAGFTNLSRDHLDYHGSMEAYLRAKARLFGEILEVDGAAVLNADDAACRSLAETVRRRGCRLISYGRQGEDIRLVAVRPCVEGQWLDLSVTGKNHSVLLPLAGMFQAENALCALGLVIAGGAEPVAAVPTLQTLQGVPGRLQRVAETAAGGIVYVDYAHTPDALANVLKALRPHAGGRLDVVFGCGGDRDRGKRPQMGRIAGELADLVIVTNDNPRHEDAAAIRAAILEACPSATEIGDRAKAIAAAVRRLGVGDILVVAGKGHETGQVIGDETLPFDDSEQIRRAVEGAE